MSKTSSRRGFLGASAAAVSSLANPGLAAAQGAGVKRADLPDLTIKEAGVYNINAGRGSTQLAGIVTNSGIEGTAAHQFRDRRCTQKCVRHVGATHR